MIEKKLIPVGNSSWGILLPKQVLQAFGINPVLDKLGIEIRPDGIMLKKLPRED